MKDVEEDPVVESVPDGVGVGYAREIICRAPMEQVFWAVATIGGLRGWWTPIAAGVVSPGGQLVFGFEGLDEAITMSVEELISPTLVRWACMEHTGATEWAGTAISFSLRDGKPGETVLHFGHLGLAGESVAAGWDRFLASLVSLVETGHGDPFRGTATAGLQVARAYHAAWTHGDFDTARSYLAPDLQTDVPINSYRDRDDFADAVANFARRAERVDLIAEFGSDDEALLLYDMHLDQVGRFRVAEHFTISGGLIGGIRHVHDTAPLRAG